MALEIYLNFEGNCYEAVSFYSKIFKTEMQNVMYYSDMPENPDFPLTDEVKKMVLHTFLNINGTTVMFSDCPPNIPLKFGNNTALVINKDNTEEIKPSSATKETANSFLLLSKALAEEGILSEFDEDTPIYLSNDRGYTFGNIDDLSFELEEIEGEMEDEDL